MEDTELTLNLRRVVTGHDAQGRAVVTIDDHPSNLVSRRPGHDSMVIWTTEETPADNAKDSDADITALPITNGSMFRLIEYAPGVASRMHRTDTIDYIVIVSGEIDMALDDGREVHLKAGDVMVQRGTNHDWINRGREPCVIAFTLLDARP